MAVFSALPAQFRSTNPLKLTILSRRARAAMVGDQFSDVTLRIEKSRTVVNQVRVAIEQSKRLVFDSKHWLAEYLTEVARRNSAGRSRRKSPLGKSLPEGRHASGLGPAVGGVGRRAR